MSCIKVSYNSPKKGQCITVKYSKGKKKEEYDPEHPEGYNNSSACIKVIYPTVLENCLCSAVKIAMHDHKHKEYCHDLGNLNETVWFCNAGYAEHLCKGAGQVMIDLFIHPDPWQATEGEIQSVLDKYNLTKCTTVHEIREAFGY